MNRNIEEIEFTIFDTETTGLEPSGGDRIVEIAGIRFKGQERISTFQSLINPQRPISPAAFAVNKINEEMLRDAPGAEEVIPNFLDFIKDSCVCSYNAGFDLAFLNNELAIIGKSLPQDLVIVDALKMAKRLLPGSERYALWFIADSLGIKIEQKHRAFSDVELTLGVFNKLKEKLKEKGITDFNNFSGLFGLDSRLLADMNNQKIAEIQQAMDLKVKLKIKYISSSNAEVSEREVVPQAIKKENNRAYLVGYCCLKRQERTFRIDGILHLEVV